MKFSALILAFFAFSLATLAAPPENLGHPRLYFTAPELAHLRALRSEPGHAAIWKNIAASADWCLTKTPRRTWIAPVSPDPIYENLYDRFYGIMADLAITEHLSFAYALSGDDKYGEAARQWILASCRAWKHEADGTPDDGKAYAVMRMLKGVAVGYDIVYDRFTDAEKSEVRDTLTRIAELYFEKYYSAPSIMAPAFCTHHAHVQWTSLGIVGLALLGESPQAQKWVDATTKKFERDLLPHGLAADGAQIEGPTFWASTMQYRLFYMDPLRRVTGVDLFKKFEPQMNADLALAAIAAEYAGGYCQNSQNVVLEPYYGQLNYYSPVLTCLAREYRRPIYQYFASWDHSLGQLQKTRATTPHGEQLLFELGGYAYCWYDPSVPAKISGAKLSYNFPSVDEAYLRRSWEPNDLLVGVSKGLLVIHAGGIPILMEPGMSDPLKDFRVQSIQDNDKTATIHAGNSTSKMQIELDRAQGKLRILKTTPGDWKWYSDRFPTRDGNTSKWPHATMRLVKGEIVSITPDGYAPLFATGFNKLKMVDPAPRKFPLVIFKPSPQHEVEMEITRTPGSD